MRWLLLGDQFHQGIGEAKLSIGVLAFGSDAGRPDQGIIGPEYQGKGIEEEYFLFHAPKLKKSGAEV